MNIETRSPPKKIDQSLDGVPQTLLMTLLVRVREPQRPNGFFKVEKAVEIVNRLEAVFSKINLVMHRHDEIAVIVRMKRFDRYGREFLERNLEGAVVHFGCGLDTRFERVDNGSVEWFDLDLPEVTDLRKKLISTESPRDVERWGTDIRLIEEWFYYAEDEPLMESFRWLRLIPGLVKSSGIHHFRLGK